MKELENRAIYEFLKRFSDIILCIIATIIAMPVMIITCVFVVLESNGNPIYSQERLGKYGRPFTLYKIRSMGFDAEKNGPQWADINDARVTNIGKFIRKTRIDELPQLYNILKGDMTIVGPRPERSVFTYEFEKSIPGFTNRLEVKPGLTGLAQVNGGYDLTPSEKLNLDLRYIEERNFKNDLKIIFKTVIVVFTGHGSR
ncbi:sugar transferase [Clostridium lacusfryxellense]|uniref:sugar transferase n=1 Tax=Clostridium lacusfryxellense TaxID=205328 RepID=UPI001C0AFCC2|nr:sugar transferase [Clostridium lacusfryxellense]MBU3110757.1 sugar transferase [Clostridium lacusfryxellense]